MAGWALLWAVRQSPDTSHPTAAPIAALVLGLPPLLFGAYRDGDGQFPAAATEVGLRDLHRR